MRHEKDIDALLDQAKSESYNQVYCSIFFSKITVFFRSFDSEVARF